MITNKELKEKPQELNPIVKSLKGSFKMTKNMDNKKSLIKELKINIYNIYMLKTPLFILFFVLSLLTGCHQTEENSEQTNINNTVIKETELIPIRYDYERLNLHLNSPINDKRAHIKWKWDAMNSNNPMPDTNGIEHYMNISQPVFYYNGETTLPSLFATTQANKIIKFSSILIFHLKNNNSITELLDSLTMIDILKDENVKQSVLKNHKYKATFKQYEETIELQLSDSENDFDNIIYEISVIP